MLTLLLLAAISLSALLGCARGGLLLWHVCGVCFALRMLVADAVLVAVMKVR